MGAAGVKEHFENSGCKVKSCEPLFLLLDDACVLESSVSTTTTGSLDVEGGVNAILDLGEEILIGIGAGAVVLIFLSIVCCVCVCCKKKKEKEIDEHDEENPEDAKEKEVAGDE